MTIENNELLKASTPQDRLKLTADRCDKALRSDVPAESVALALTINSRNGHTYTPEFVVQLSKLSQDTQSKVGITARQTCDLVQLRKDVIEEDGFNDDFSFVTIFDDDEEEEI